MTSLQKQDIKEPLDEKENTWMITLCSLLAPLTSTHPIHCCFNELKAVGPPPIHPDTFHSIGGSSVITRCGPRLLSAEDSGIDC